MRYNMSEKYVKEIFEKLDEIEKLHAKLRSLVPRVKNNELEITENKQSVAKETKENKHLPEQKPITLKSRIRKLFSKKTKPHLMKYFKKFKNNSGNKWKELKNRLAALKEPDIILVSRASQVSDGDISKLISEEKSPKKKRKLFNRKKTAPQDFPDQLLKHLGKNTPHKVQKKAVIQDEDIETLKIVSSAKKIPTTPDGLKWSSLLRHTPSP
ncbi:uncharacterized protein LOC100867341 isoform X2 [Apis florea]|uniref:uncharacterized protein LOC100867341 isoform X2 n=1 Tax=Apis florea TaxID=7463 RepID=UPI0006299A12|nr:uncharacterized protein LOC100867341 isoform X2 [Apis florea]